MKRASESRPQAPFQRPCPLQPRRPLRRLDPCPHELFGEKKGEMEKMQNQESDVDSKRQCQFVN